MEMSKIEMADGFQTKRESDEESAQKLGSHLGILLNILELTGLPIKEFKKVNMQGRLLYLLKKLCFPTFIHFSMLYLLYDTLTKGGLQYGTIIDTILPVLPCVMWVLMRRQKTLKPFLGDLGDVTSRNLASSNRRLSYTTNAALCFVIIYPLLLIGMRFAQGNEVTVKEVFRILQEAIFPWIMVITYASISYLLLQNLRFCKKMFDKRLDLTNPTEAKNMMKDYLDVVKSVEMFENLLSNIAFVLVLQDFCIETILVFDMFYVSEFTTKIMFEAICELVYILISLGIMSSFAGNISLEMAAIKSVVLEKTFTQMDPEDLKNNDKHAILLLKKDVSVLTAGKIFVFDRAFILKALVAVFAEVVLLCEIISPFNH